MEHLVFILWSSIHIVVKVLILSVSMQHTYLVQNFSLGINIHLNEQANVNFSLYLLLNLTQFEGRLAVCLFFFYA